MTIKFDFVLCLRFCTIWLDPSKVMFSVLALDISIYLCLYIYDVIYLYICTTNVALAPELMPYFTYISSGANIMYILLIDM